MSINHGWQETLITGAPPRSFLGEPGLHQQPGALTLCYVPFPPIVAHWTQGGSDPLGQTGPESLSRFCGAFQLTTAIHTCRMGPTERQGYLRAEAPGRNRSREDLAEARGLQKQD